MRKYGIIGKSLKHSHARQINALIGDYDYNMIEVSDEEELAAVLARREFSGFNVTSPYRNTVVRYLDELDASAERIGAVNLIKRLPDGRLRGYNTDEAMHALIKGLRSKNWYIRVNSAESLAKNGIHPKYIAYVTSGNDRFAIEALISALASEKNGLG